MKSSSFSPLNTSGQPGGSQILDRMLAAIKRALDLLANQSIGNQNLVSAFIAASPNDTVVSHGLGQMLQSWEIVDRDANAVVWRSPTANPTPTLTIILRASAAVNVVLRFA